MQNLLVIGYGNPLCGDDGVAWHVVDALKNTLPEESLVAVHQLTPELADRVSETEIMVFVDAAVGETPGEVCHFSLLPAAGMPGSHDMSPEGILAMASELYGHCPTAYMIAITGGCFDISERLTPAVSSAVPQAVSLVQSLIKWVKDSSPEPSPL